MDSPRKQFAGTERENFDYSSSSERSNLKRKIESSESQTRTNHKNLIDLVNEDSKFTENGPYCENQDKITVRLSIIKKPNGIRFGKVKFDDYLKYLQNKYPVEVTNLNKKLKDI